MRPLSVLIIVSLFIASCDDTPQTSIPPRPVLATKLGDVSQLNKRFFPGKAKATQDVNLAFEVAGTIIDRPVNLGDRVKKNQLLARIDPRDFENELLSATAELERAQAHRDRIAVAAKAGAVAKQDLTDAEAILKSALAEVGIKQKALDDTLLKAPFDAYVSKTFVELHQRVKAQENIVRLVDLSSIEMTVDIPEHIMSALQYVKEVHVRFDAHPDVDIPAVITEIGTEASDATRTYPVTLAFDQPKAFQILPGMSGNAFSKSQAPTIADRSALFIPINAVFTGGVDGKETFVWLINPDTMVVSKHPVTIDSFDTNGFMVQGLKVGDMIVIAGVHHLSEGQTITISTTETAP